MSARTKARKRALDILYAADLRNEDITVALSLEAERALDEPEVESCAVGRVGRDAQAHVQLAPLLELDHVHQLAAWHVDRLVGANPR